MSSGYTTILDAGAQAPWLVMVHGMSQDHRFFSAQADAFKDRYRIQLIDLLGHGLAADAAGPFGYREFAAHVAGAMDDAGIARCTYWATHTGTAVALLLAAAEPRRFRGLVLEGTVIPGHTMPSVDAELGRIREVAKRDGMAEARRQWFEEAEWFSVMRSRPEACRADGHRAMVADFAGAPWLYTAGDAAPVTPVDDAMPAIDMPVLLYNGEHDLPDFFAAADVLEQHLPNVTRATVPDGGCFPAWEYPDRVNRLVAEFLTTIPEDRPL